MEKVCEATEQLWGKFFVLRKEKEGKRESRVEGRGRKEMMEGAQNL